MFPDPLTEAALRAALGSRPFRVFESVASTQDAARAWALAVPPAPAGAAVFAEHQSAGRGRQGRAWIAPPGGALIVSVVLRPHIVPQQVPRLSIVGGLAVVEVLAGLDVPGLALKWPNDVLLGGRKVCGVLAEATWNGDQLAAVVLGIGINFRVDFAGTDLEFYATSLELALGRSLDRREVAGRLLAQVDRWAAVAAAPGGALIEAWRNWLDTLGQRVTVEGGGDRFNGLAEDVDDDGALVVRLDSGERRRVVAADVTLRLGE